MKAGVGIRGFSLIELILVIVIIGIIASIALRSMTPAARSAREKATMEEMENLARAIVGNPQLVSDGIRTDYGYVGDVGSLPPNLDALIANPGGYSTWRGPYILNSFTQNPEDFKRDAWGDYYSYSGGVSISSGGGGSPMTKIFASSISQLTANTIKGNVYDGLGSVPGDSSVNVVVTITYPDGAGSMASLSTAPAPDGSFSFDGLIPIGNHLVRCVYMSASDTTAQYVSIPPGSVGFCELRFAGSLW